MKATYLRLFLFTAVAALTTAAVLVPCQLCLSPPGATASPGHISASKIVQAIQRQTPDKLKLEVEGDTFTVVRRLPFLIQCAADADLYFWTYPVGVAAEDQGKTLKVTAASAQSSIVISLKTITVDWDKKKVVQRFGVIIVAIGDVPPGPQPPGPQPPDPQPPLPVDKLEADLLSVWKAEGPTQAKAGRLKLLAEIYRAASNLADDPNIKTAYQLYFVGVLGAVQNTFKPLDETGAEFVALRKIIGAELTVKLPSKVGEPLTADNRLLCKTQLLRVAVALDKVGGAK